MKDEARKANMKTHNIWQLAQEAREEHCKYSIKNSKQARLNIGIVAATLVTRRL